MKILTNYSLYKQAIKKIEPNKVAVAYIGADYNLFINAKKLKEIIVSPTVGSNPHAISSLIKSIGISNVHFIDNLHSKLFIGKKGAIIGSANLSRNALGGSGLIELGVLIESQRELSQVTKLFNDYKKTAKRLYKNSTAKEEKIAKLYVDHRKPLVINGSKTPLKIFSEYQWGVDEPFKVSWYDVIEPDIKSYVKKSFYKAFPGATWKDIYNNIRSEIEIPMNDSLQEGEWLLTFCVDEKYLCMKSGLDWMHIDVRIKNAFTKEFYPNGFFELKSIKHSSPPFKIDKKFRKIFVEVVNQAKYKTVRESMYIKNITPFIPKILKEIKKRY